MRALRLGMVVLASVTLLWACGPSTAKLTGTMWKLTAVTMTGTGSAIPPGIVPVADQARYTITFNDDGTFDATADCNNVGGSYTTNGNSITITPGPSTLVACPADSYGDAFVTALGQAAAYAVGGSVLTLTLSGGNSLTFG
ncbi:MAG: META domain-containing protein [Chloroflexota bacterium]